MLGVKGASGVSALRLLNFVTAIFLCCAAPAPAAPALAAAGAAAPAEGGHMSSLAHLWQINLVVTVMNAVPRYAEIELQFNRLLSFICSVAFSGTGKSYDRDMQGI